MLYVAPCVFGLESLVSAELKEMGAENVRSENGRVYFEGDKRILIRANIRSRFAERILIVVSSFEAHTFTELFDGTKNADWETFIGKYDAFPVKGSTISSDLFSVSDCQSIIKKAVVERLKQTYDINFFDETGVKYQIEFAIIKNMAYLMIDTSGQGLHKRGYRENANAAPLKETLAAALCAFSHLRGYHTLYDPMCGSGTILIEGAMLANNIYPGINRFFAADRFPQLPEGLWREEKELAKGLKTQNSTFKAFGSDIDENSLNIARENAEKAGVSEFIEFKKKDVASFSLKTEKGTVITNPPYGERLGDKKEAERIIKTLGRVFAKKHGVSYTVISPDEQFEKLFGRRADKRRKLYNGMIKCQMYSYFK